MDKLLRYVLRMDQGNTWSTEQEEEKEEQGAEAREEEEASLPAALSFMICHLIHTVSKGQHAEM